MSAIDDLDAESLALKQQVATINETRNELRARRDALLAEDPAADVSGIDEQNTEAKAEINRLNALRGDLATRRAVLVTAEREADAAAARDLPGVVVSPGVATVATPQKGN